MHHQTIKQCRAAIAFIRDDHEDSGGVERSSNLSHTSIAFLHFLNHHIEGVIQTTCAEYAAGNNRGKNDLSEALKTFTSFLDEIESHTHMIIVADVDVTTCRRAIAAIHASIQNLAGGDPSALLDNHCLGLLLLLGRQTGIDSVTTYGRKQHITVALDPHDPINDIHVRLSVLEEYLAKCVHFLNILEGKRREKNTKKSAPSHK